MAPAILVLVHRTQSPVRFLLFAPSSRDCVLLNFAPIVERSTRAIILRIGPAAAPLSCALSQARRGHKKFPSRAYLLAVLHDLSPSEIEKCWA